jgi:hypothetical protein
MFFSCVWLTTAMIGWFLGGVRSTKLSVVGPTGTVVAAVAAFALLISLSACGGGSASATVAGTPPQTYTLVLTGTAADGTSRTLNLTLIVQ